MLLSNQIFGEYSGTKTEKEFCKLIPAKNQISNVLKIKLNEIILLDFYIAIVNSKQNEPWRSLHYFTLTSHNTEDKRKKSFI